MIFFKNVALVFLNIVSIVLIVILISSFIKEEIYKEGYIQRWETTIGLHGVIKNIILLLVLGIIFALLGRRCSFKIFLGCFLIVIILTGILNECSSATTETDVKYLQLFCWVSILGLILGVILKTRAFVISLFINQNFSKKSLADT